MDYYITVIDNNEVVEKILFSDRITALAFVDRRRKQGYTVTLKVVSLAYEFKGE